MANKTATQELSKESEKDVDVSLCWLMCIFCTRCMLVKTSKKVANDKLKQDKKLKSDPENVSVAVIRYSNLMLQNNCSLLSV